MAKFKIGDRVRIKEGSHYGLTSAKSEGTIQSIEETEYGRVLFYKVTGYVQSDLHDKPETFHVLLEDLELIPFEWDN